MKLAFPQSSPSVRPLRLLEHIGFRYDELQMTKLRFFVAGCPCHKKRMKQLGLVNLKQSCCRERSFGNVIRFEHVSEARPKLLSFGSFYTSIRQPPTEAMNNFVLMSVGKKQGETLGSRRVQ